MMCTDLWVVKTFDLYLTLAVNAYQNFQQQQKNCNKAVCKGHKYIDSDVA